jgi:hypothetical protein
LNIEVDVNLPDLSDTTFDILAQSLPHQVHTTFDTLSPLLKASVIKIMTVCMKITSITVKLKMSSLLLTV